MRSPDISVGSRAPLSPLLIKELWDILGGRALWIMLLLLCPLVGYSFFQAVSLYADASQSAQQSPILATSLSPLDGILAPTLGGFYVGVTLLFPFVAIRVLGNEKESGSLRLLIQLPYQPATLIAAKLAAVATAWLLCAVPAFSALAIWVLLGGHLCAAETLNLLAGQLLYGCATSNGKEPLRPRAGGDYGLVSGEPASVHPRPARPSDRDDAGPLCLLRHNRQLSTPKLVRPSGRDDLAEVAVAAGP